MERAVIQTLCDLCWKVDDAEVEREADQTRIITIGTKSYRLQTCADHEGKSWSLSEVMELFAKYGDKVDQGKAVAPRRVEPQRVPDRKRGEGKLQYPCSKCDRVFKRIDSWRKHEWSKHGIGEPVDGEVICDFPGCGKPYHSSGIYLHMSRSHGLKGVLGRPRSQQPALIEYNNRLRAQAEAELAQAR